MRALSASEIIRLWETAYRFHPIDQALSILIPVMPEHNRDELAALPVGQRNTLLLALRRATFGESLPGQCHCPQCDETVEFELNCSVLSADVTEPQHKHLDLNGYSITVRPLNSYDLAAAAGEATLQQARELLLQRSVTRAQYHGHAIELETLPHEIENCITETTLAADPQAEIELDLNCPVCMNHWNSVLDIGHILWLEISARAQQLLMEVHMLARSYGWGEAEILRLSPTRRATYLQMATV